MKFGILFAGQGAQKPGMGLDFLADPTFSQVIETAHQATGLDIVKIMASENGELDQTNYVQPALVAVSVGIYKMLERDCPNLPLAGMMGLSLGEYAALIASGMLDEATGFKLVADRGQYMQTDCEEFPGKMAALVLPDLTKVSQIVTETGAVVANYNSPAQVVIGGRAEAVDAAISKIRAAKAAKKVVPLRVRGAFHTPLMNNSKAKLAKRLEKVEFKNSLVPVISNTTVKPFDLAGVKNVLAHQVASPTHFGEDLAYLNEHGGLTATLEIGPGKTLSTFAKQTNRQLKRFNISNLADYQAFIKEQADGFKQ